MYKTKITLWGLDKKQKWSDVQAILQGKRTRKERRQPPCMFALRGWLVDEKKLDRYCKRAKLDECREEDLTGCSLPQDLVCIEASERAILSLRDPSCFRIVQQLLHGVTVLVESALDQGIWAATDKDQWLFSFHQDRVRDVSMLSRMTSDIDYACWLFSRREWYSAGLCLRRAFVHLEAVANSTYHDLVPEVLALVARLRQTPYSEIGTKIVQYLAQLTRHTNRSNCGPSRDVFDVLKNPDLEIDGDLMGVVRSYLRTLYHRRLGEDHIAVVELDLESEKEEAVPSGSIELLSGMQSSIKAFDLRFGPLSRRSLINLATKCQRLRNAGLDFDVAERRFRRELLGRMTNADSGSRQIVHRECLSQLDTLSAMEGARCELAGRGDIISRAKDALHKRSIEDNVQAFHNSRHLWCESMQNGENRLATHLECVIDYIIQLILDDGKGAMLLALLEMEMRCSLPSLRLVRRCVFGRT